MHDINIIVHTGICNSLVMPWLVYDKYLPIKQAVDLRKKKISRYSAYLIRYDKSNGKPDQPVIVTAHTVGGNARDS